MITNLFLALYRMIATLCYYRDQHPNPFQAHRVASFQGGCVCMLKCPAGCTSVRDLVNGWPASCCSSVLVKRMPQLGTNRVQTPLSLDSCWSMSSVCILSLYALYTLSIHSLITLYRTTRALCCFALNSFAFNHCWTSSYFAQFVYRWLQHAGANKPGFIPSHFKYRPTCIVADRNRLSYQCKLQDDLAFFPGDSHSRNTYSKALNTATCSSIVKPASHWINCCIPTRYCPGVQS